MVASAVLPVELCSRCSAPNVERTAFCRNCDLYLSDESRTTERATRTRRFFGDFYLEEILFLLTLGVGWFIWFAFTARDGQTPAKKLLNVYVVKVRTGTVASAGDTWVREIVAKWLLFYWSSLIVGIPWLVDIAWPLWDADRQALHDKVAGSVIVYAPFGLPDAMRPRAEAANWSSSTTMPSTARQAGVVRGTGVSDVAEQMRELKRLRDEDLISDEEYQRKRGELASRL